MKRVLIPVAVSLLLALLPAPAGLAPHAWLYLAIFAGVVVALVLEPLPGGAVGLIGVVLVSVLARWVFFSPQELAKPGFRPEQAVVGWALSGFANSTVWLIFSAFMFALGYDKTGLGRRLALVLVRRMGGHTLTLGYAIVLADLVLAPFTPSNTARSGGTIFPVIRNLPALFDSRPNDPSARRIGGYLMWVAIAGTCVTSSLFMTGLATNLLALELIRTAGGVSLGWTEWFVAFLPAGGLLLAGVPLLTWWLYPPEVKSGRAVQGWAQAELAGMGSITGREIALALLVGLALAGWIFGGAVVHPTVVALAVIAGMLLGRIVAWEDVLGHKQAWNTLAWFATLVALADGLARTGFVKWFAESAGRALEGVAPGAASTGLLAAFYFSHYFFASTTAHATALLPVMLIVGQAVPGLDAAGFALQLALTLGLMGILTPYATGPSPIYYGSGYIASRDYWRLGAIFGAIFFAVFMAVTLPWMAWLRD
ncbi:MAG: DASS family sodium-coupled anion symporter [Opitutaceae bacterium]|nr:DASS family sodium-coupled anion symporter [Opitutaceae bacterium]